MLYRGRYRIATFEECLGLAVTTTLAGTTLALGFLSICPPGMFPRAVALLTPPVALLSMAAGRLAFRALRERVVPNPDAEKVLIYGAGDAGYQLVRLLKQDRSSRLQVVGFIDDAKNKRNLRLLGVPVLGQRTQLVDIAAEHGVTTVILSVANASSTMVRRMSQLVEGAGLRLLVVPPVHELIGGRLQLSDIREVDIGDLLGRHQVRTKCARSLAT